MNFSFNFYLVLLSCAFLVPIQCKKKRSEMRSPDSCDSLRSLMEAIGCRAGAERGIVAYGGIPEPGKPQGSVETCRNRQVHEGEQLTKRGQGHA